MRFAILGSRGYPSTYGGYETLVRQLAPYLVEQGHEVTVYCRSRDEGRRIWETDGVRCIAPPGIETTSLSTLSFGLSSTVDASLRRFDAVLVLNIANGFWFPLLRMTSTPFAVNTDGIEWERGKWSRAGRATFKAGARMTARHASTLICDSQAIAAIWEEIFDRRSNFIPYGAPVLENPGSDCLEELGLADKTYVLAVARLVPENNVELMLDALELLGDDAPTAVIVGSANMDSPIEDRLRAADATGRVKWLGHVGDQRLLNQLWGNSSAYVHGHSVGGTNPSLLQAMGAGAPTLALDTPFNSEVIPHHQHLFPLDSELLAERISAVVGSPAIQREMSARGQAIVRDRYDWENVCRAYMNILKSVAESRTGAPLDLGADSDEQVLAGSRFARERNGRVVSEQELIGGLVTAATVGEPSRKEA